LSSQVISLPTGQSLLMTKSRTWMGPEDAARLRAETPPKGTLSSGLRMPDLERVFWGVLSPRTAPRAVIVDPAAPPSRGLRAHPRRGLSHISTLRLKSARARPTRRLSLDMSAQCGGCRRREGCPSSDVVMEPRPGVTTPSGQAHARRFIGSVGVKVNMRATYVISRGVAGCSTPSASSRTR
jgi:hypothetical protein